MQCAGKSADLDLSGLVHALNDILHPQANLCSMGMDKHLEAQEIAKLVEQAAAKWHGSLVVDARS